MSKELTEQWREGTLESGWYYVVIEWNDEIRMLYFEGDYFLDADVPLDNDNIKEVLDDVPSYDEYNEQATKCSQLEEDVKILKKQLEIATKALEYYTLEDAYVSCYGNPVNPNPMVARKALKEMEGVK